MLLALVTALAAAAAAPAAAVDARAPAGAAATDGASDGDDDEPSVGAAAAAPSRTGARPPVRRGRVPPHERDHNPRKRAHGPVAIPIDVGVGPVVMLANPPIFQNQPVFTGLELSLAAVIDKQLIEEHRDQIPASMRGAARGLNEVRIRPWFLALIPERVILSPQIEGIGFHTGMYGAVWRPFGAGLDLVNTKSFDVSIDGALDLAAAFLHSSTLGGGAAGNDSITIFVRPGVNLALTAELALSDSLFLTGGWSSDLFIPQPLGGTPFDLTPLDKSLWHLGGPFLQLHVRIPYEVTL